MHPNRKLVLVRWVLCLALVGGGIVLVSGKLESRSESPAFQPSQERLPEVSVNTFDQEEAQLIRTLLASMGSYPLGSEQKIALDSSLVVNTKHQQGPIHLTLTAPGKYAIINGKLYRPGDRLDDGRVLQAVFTDRIVLRTEGKKEVFSWRTPLRVELVRGSGNQGEKTTDEIDQEANRTVRNKSLSPDEVLQILNSLGQQGT